MAGLRLGRRSCQPRLVARRHLLLSTVHPGVNEFQHGCSEFRRLCTKLGKLSLLCATSECSVSLWFTIAEKNNHRDTENTEVAQRRSRITDFSCKALLRFSSC